MDSYLIDFQVNSILLHLALEARKPQPKYPAGTIIDGINVGGKWMSLDDKGTQNKDDKLIKNIDTLLSTSQKNIVSATKDLTPDQQKDVLVQASILVVAPETKGEINRIGKIFKDIHPSLADGWNQTVKVIQEEFAIASSSIKENFKRIGERVSLLVKAAKARPDLVSLSILGALELIAVSAIVLAIDFTLQRVLFPKKVLLRTLSALGTIAPKIMILREGLLNLSSAFERLDMEADQQEKAELLRTKLFGDDPKSSTLSARAVRVLADNDIDVEEIDSALKREKARGHQNRSHSFANRIEEYVELVSIRNVWDYNHADSIEWHKGIIDAEIKYGEQIDAMSRIPLVNVFSSKTSVVYKDFISTMKKGKTGKVQIRTVDDKFIKDNFYPNAKFYKEGFEADFTEQKLVNIKERIKEVSDASTALASLSNIDLETIVIGHGKGLTPNSKASGTNDGSRGFAWQIKKDLTYIEVGLIHDNVFLGFHETGHVLEHHSPHLSRISGDYAKNGRYIDGKSKNIDSIVTTKTDFANQYVGKLYPNSDGTISGTEVISSGCQELSTPERLHRIAITDPDYLRFTLYALDRKP